MRVTKQSLLSVAIAATITFAGLVPAQAAVTADLVGNGNCDFSAAGQGRGSALDPYLINTALDLRELNDCQSRYKGISNGVVNEDGTATFTVESNHGAFGAGQPIYIRYTDGGVFDDDSATVISATDTTITVKTSAPAGSVTNTGQIQAFGTSFKLNADINLGAASTESWNNNSEISITAATRNSDGSITFKGANTLLGGEWIYIDGMGDKRFNQGWVYVNSATADEFVTTSTFSFAEGPATSANGKAHYSGWSPYNLDRVDFDGAGHTISGMKIYRHDSYVGLFGWVSSSTIRNLTISGATVDTTSTYLNDARDHFGILAGYIERSILDNINIQSSNVIAGGGYAGLLAGSLWGTALTNSTFSGTIKASATTAPNDEFGWWDHFGGVAGLSDASTLRNVSVAVPVDASTLSQDSRSDATGTPTISNYFSYVGGIFGRTGDSARLENVTSSGDVKGARFIGGAIGEMANNGSLNNITTSGNVTSTFASQQMTDIDHVGGFSGRLAGYSDNYKLTATGNVSVTMPVGNSGAIRYIGGFSGETYCCGTNKALKSTGNVTIEQPSANRVSYIGGLLGRNDRTPLSGSTSNSSVTIHANNAQVYYVGGVVGFMESGNVQSNNTRTGNLTITFEDTSAGYAWDIGGYAGRSSGYSNYGDIKVTGNLSIANGHRIGGFVGEEQGESQFQDISVTGNLSDSYLGTEVWDNAASVGGLIGVDYGRASLDRVSVRGNVTATPIGDSVAYNVGGLIGYINYSNTLFEVTNSTYRGSVSGTNNVGGFVGYSAPDMNYKFDHDLVVAQVTASATNAKSDTVMINMFRDGTGSSFIDRTVAGKYDNHPLFNAETSANLKLAGTYTARGWSFTGSSPWRISAAVNDGYPYLLSPNSDTQVTPPVDTPTGITYTLLSSVNFTKQVVVLSPAQKKTLTALAKTISKSTYTVFVVDAAPSANNFALATKRAVAVQTYLSAELKKLKSKKVIGLSVQVKTTGGTTAIKVNGGK